MDHSRQTRSGKVQNQKEPRVGGRRLELKNKPGPSTVQLSGQSKASCRQSSSTSRLQSRHHEEEGEETSDSDKRKTEHYESDKSSVESQDTGEVEDEDEEDSQKAQQRFHGRKRTTEKFTTKHCGQQQCTKKVDDNMENSDMTDEDSETADKEKRTKRKRKAGPVNRKVAQGMAPPQKVRPNNQDTLLKTSGSTKVLAEKTQGQERFRFLLLGKTGSGKSSTGNTILGGQHFPAACSFSSVTAECAMEEAVVDGARVEILDCPGLCDISRHDEETAILISKATGDLDPGPQALFYVLKAESFTAEEYTVFQKLQNLFDQRVLHYLIVIITGGDSFEHDGQSEEEVINSAPPELKDLLNDCDNRYIVFNNRAQDPKPQVRRLLDMVRQMVRANGNESHYRCPKYDNFGKELEKEVRRKVAEVEQRNLQKQQTFQVSVATEKTKMDDKLQKKKEDFQRKVANKEMSEAEEKKKLKKLQDEQNAKLEKLDKELADMKKKDEEGVKHKGEEIEKTVKTETVEGKGLVAKVKEGTLQVCTGAINVVAAPFEAVSSWWSGKK